MLATGRRLHSFAEHLSVELEFCPVVVTSMTDFTPTSITSCSETLIVNFMLQLHELLGDDGSPAVQRVLKSVAALKPSLVTLTEYDAALNGAEFKPKFIDALHFYCALFDALDATMARDCQDRLNVESNYFARQIENIVACEGKERTQRHESCEQWSRHMQNAGFVSVALSHYAHSQAQQLLWQYCDNFRLQRPPGGCLSLTWQDRSLITVSAWKLCNNDPSGSPK